MLLIFTLLVTSKQFFGEPIHCIAEGEHNDKDAVNSYCWIYGTYTLKSNLYGKIGSSFASIQYVPTFLYLDKCLKPRFIYISTML